MTRALVIVDVQRDFCPGGSLPVPGGDLVAAALTEYVTDCVDHPNPGYYEKIVATKDWHIAPGDHFSAAPDYKTTWPVHCAAGTTGSDFHPALDVSVDAVLFKGQFKASYSGFDAKTITGSKLATYLWSHGVTHVDICGLATDYCVKATALDAVKLGFHVTLLTKLVAGVSPDSTREALAEMAAAGVTVIPA